MPPSETTGRQRIGSRTRPSLFSGFGPRYGEIERGDGGLEVDVPVHHEAPGGVRNPGVARYGAAFESGGIGGVAGGPSGLCSGEPKNGQKNLPCSAFHLSPSMGLN